MTGRPRRVGPRIVLVAAAFAAAALLLAFATTRRFLRSRLDVALPLDEAARIAHDFDIAFIAAIVLGIALAVSLALMVSSFASRTLARLRSAAQDRARGETPNAPASGLAEVRLVATAIEQLAAGLEAEAARLRGERDEASLLVESVSEGILLVAAAGRVVEANAAARALLGLPKNCRGQALETMIRHAQLRGFLASLKTGVARVDEIALDERRLLVRARPVARDARGAAEETRTVITVVDLTELRRLEGVRRDFVANVSHELKTPLTSIMGYIETVLSDDLQEDTRRQFLEVVHNNAQRLHGLVDDLLDLSRLESGGWQPQLQTVDVREVADAAWVEYRDRAGRNNIRFVAPASTATVRADPAALRQILANLFDNALRYTPPGGTIGVRIEAEPIAARRNGAYPARFVRIGVADTGSGIPSDALPRIFERFFRVDPARSRAEGGTGLGLSIVKHLTEAMGGEVSAESELGRGTTVRVRLPAP